MLINVFPFRLNPTPALDHSTVQPFRRGWAKGGRRKMLEDGMDGYIAARRKGKSQAIEYADTIFNAMCAKYPYNLPMDQEPPAILPTAHLDLELSPFERDRKAALLERLSTVRFIPHKFSLILTRPVLSIRAFETSTRRDGPRQPPSQRCQKLKLEEIPLPPFSARSRGSISRVNALVLRCRCG